MKRYRRVEFFNWVESYNTTVEADGKWDAAEKVANELEEKQDERAYWSMRVIEL